MLEKTEVVIKNGQSRNKGKTSVPTQNIIIKGVILCSKGSDTRVLPK